MRIPTSLKIFFVVVLLLVIEYLFFEKLFYPTGHLLSFVGAVTLSWTMYEKISRIRLYSSGRLFGAFLLSVGLFIGGFIIEFLVFAMSFPFTFYFTNLYDLYLNIYSLDPSVYHSIETFLLFFGLGLMILGGYLNFRFMRKAGVIIFPR